MACYRLLPPLTRRLAHLHTLTEVVSNKSISCQLSTQISALPVITARHILPNRLSSCLINTKLQQDSVSQERRSASTGWLLKVRQKLGLSSKMRYPKYRLARSSYSMYMCSTEIPDYIEMIHDFQLEDTYLSWFLLSELHVWLILVRLSQAQLEGEFVRKNFVKAFWTDVKKRTSKVGGGISQNQEAMHELVFHFNAALFSYDEGLMSSDTLLASALWRNLFASKYTEPQNLELAVQYVRKQVKHLESQSDDSILYNGLVSFLPLHSDKEETARIKSLWKKIYETDILIPK
ncbi:ubiquinol-cytochrome-c reductase complex assembly factor 1 [Octopus bimaculoides]|uniref:Ubiquinol-cytochrome c chaperone domain-containing protein n=1 Tax=Octopus bimaculoides TaxID=37653 RepID=A0A0L8HPG1_OCTBM|nr:ubiquinol-cytochrome-c reductase complex assembly factor 1 [Octopus bimaculoides]|eukprot:XP_014770614.1 PREDICTED: ubiquinol-cytochrome-c reductase complex assembly factor 1-like [Octopus bimaculoides]